MHPTGWNDCLMGVNMTFLDQTCSYRSIINTLLICIFRVNQGRILNNCTSNSWCRRIYIQWPTEGATTVPVIDWRTSAAVVTAAAEQVLFESMQRSESLGTMASHVTRSANTAQAAFSFCERVRQIRYQRNDNNGQVYCHSLAVVRRDRVQPDCHMTNRSSHQDVVISPGNFR